MRRSKKDAIKEAGQLAVIVDRRESCPLPFPAGTPMVWGDVKVGRYSIAGYEDKVAVDRFSLSGLVAGVCNKRSETWKRLTALAELRHRMVVVDAALGEVIMRQYQGRVDPRAVLGSVNAIQIDMGIPVVWAGHEFYGARMVESFLRLAVLRILEGHNGKAKIMSDSDRSGAGAAGSPGVGADDADGRKVRGHHGAAGNQRAGSKTGKPTLGVRAEKRPKA